MLALLIKNVPLYKNISTNWFSKKVNIKENELEIIVAEVSYLGEYNLVCSIMLLPRVADNFGVIK